jgi:hypothetical protein
MRVEVVHPAHPRQDAAITPITEYRISSLLRFGCEPTSSDKRALRYGERIRRRTAANLKMPPMRLSIRLQSRT